MSYIELLRHIRGGEPIYPFTVKQAVLNPDGTPAFDEIEKSIEDLKIDTRKARYYNNIEDLKADKELLTGQICKTLGYYEPNDGGSGTYYICDKTDSDIDNGGSIHELQGSLVAKLIIDNEVVFPEQFGAKGDGITDDTCMIQSAIDYYPIVHLVSGKTYKITNQLTYTGKDTRIFDGKNATIKMVGNQRGSETGMINEQPYDFTESTQVFAIIPTLSIPENITIKNLSIDCGGKTTEDHHIAIKAPYVKNLVLYNLSIYNCYNGIEIGGIVNTLSNCSIQDIGLNGILFNNCIATSMLNTSISNGQISVLNSNVTMSSCSCKSQNIGLYTDNSIVSFDGSIELNIEDTTTEPSYLTVISNSTVSLNATSFCLNNPLLREMSTGKRFTCIGNSFLSIIGRFKDDSDTFDILKNDEDIVYFNMVKQ